tara:strand:- start:641 stop:1921 length:1281 start_codon:yes stop_codon:yes gene_type:complete
MIKYYLKYFVYDGKNNLLRSSFFLPFLAIIIGSLVMLLSFSIMTGFSNEIFRRIHFFEKENIILINKKELIHNDIKNDLIKYLDINNYIYNFYENRIMFVRKNNQTMFSNVYAVNNFSLFSQNIDSYSMLPKSESSLDSSLEPINIKDYQPHSKSQFNDFDDKYCIIGSDLAYQLDLKIGDELELHSVLDFNNFSLSGYPKKTFIISHIFNSDIYEYDSSVWIAYYGGKYNQIKNSDLFSKNLFLTINLNKQLQDVDKNYVQSNFKGLQINNQNHFSSELSNAIEYEKLVYYFFGFFIILISSIMIIGFNISSIIQNRKSIGILYAFGFNKNSIKWMYFLNTLFVALIGSVISFLFFKIIIFLDVNFNLMNYIFPHDIYFDFSLSLENNTMLRIFMLNISIILLSVLYPINKINKINIIDAIKNRG